MTGVHVQVRLGAERYALPVEAVREVLAVGAVTPVPGAPRAVVGVQDVHGAVVPVLDPSSLLGAPVSPAPRQAILVETGGASAALLVDEVEAVDELPGELQERDQPCLLGAVVRPGALVGVIDVETLLEHAR